MRQQHTEGRDTLPPEEQARRDAEHERAQKSLRHHQSSLRRLAGIDGDPETLLANLIERLEASQALLNQMRGYYVIGMKDNHFEERLLKEISENRVALSPFAGKKETQGE